MTLSEILIIYLSLGAPVGVYFLQRQADTLDRSRTVRIVLAFVLWPAALVGTIARGDRPTTAALSARTVDESHDQLIQTIFEIAKRDLSRLGRGQETAQFREMVERYSGLLGSRSSETGSDMILEFCSAAGHPNPKLAAACHLRRFAQRLDSHAAAASDEIREFFRSTQTSDELRSAMASLAEMLGDEPTSDVLIGRTDRQLPLGRRAA